MSGMNDSRLSWGYAAIALLSCVPVFLVKYPPIQDLPLHLATMRVIHSYGDPAYAFQHDFVLTLGRTQYVLYYLLGSLMAHVVGLTRANLVLVSAYLGGSVLSMRSLLAALRRDERLCLAIVPLVYNVMFLFGLLPFLLAIPAMLWAIATTVRYFERPTVGRGVLLAALAAALFYLHVFPFMLFGLAFAALFPWRRVGQWFALALPAAPAVALVVWWTLLTPEGRLAKGALFRPEVPSPLSPLGKLKDSFNWVGDVYRDLSEETILGGLALLLLAGVVLARGDRLPKSKLAVYAVVPVSCLVLMSVTGEQHGHIWLIWQRFPLLFLVTALPFLRLPDGRAGRWLTAGLALTAGAAVVDACVHFIRFQRDDVADFDQALDAMEPRKRVAGLIFDKVSSVAHRHPLVHFVSYYQALKGGVVEFTFAGYPHWPFTFKAEEAPPQGMPVRLNWEWTPEKVTIDELYPYFDYVLTRGEGFAPPEGTYRVKWSGKRWKVWERE